ncbi:PCRF domain-containing protein [Chloroflexota bacterium]
MALPEVAADLAKLQELARERARLEDMVRKYRAYQETAKQLKETQSMLNEGLDEEMASLAKEEIASLETKLENQLHKLAISSFAKDANDARDIIMEIRAGAGGDEAAIFAADLFRMYSRYAQSKGWKAEIISMSESGIGGFREIIFEIRGKGAFSRLKYERGGLFP